MMEAAKFTLKEKETDQAFAELAQDEGLIFCS